MSNDGDNGNEDFYSPEAFAMAAWGLLTVTVEKLKERDPDFETKAIKLFDHLLGRTIAGADPEHETIKKEARKIFEQMVRRDLVENRIAWRRFMNRLRGDGTSRHPEL
jgi:hypothetical protein